MNITYDGGATITATGIYPNNDPVATKNFTVTGNNTTGLKMGYSLSLIMEEKGFSVGALKYKLTSTNTGVNGEVVPAISDAKDLYYGPSSNLLGTGYFNETSGNKVHTYTLNMYFPESEENQNEDQGKSFKAHVAISDMACTDCLRDNILAQGGGAQTINAKTTPDFSKITPEIINYKEKTSEYMSAITSNNNKAIGLGYTFNVTAGNYTLTNYVTNKSYGSEYIGYYTCESGSYSNCTTMYKINAVSGTSVTNATKYEKEIKAYDYGETGIYKAEDDYGTSYYYRGAPENNYVVFAGMCWRVVRVIGDGSIKLTLYNYNPNAVGNPCDSSQDGGTNAFARYSGTTYITAFNTQYNDAKYVGYMYGGLSGVASTSRAQATTNETNSTIKTNLDTWYTAKLSSQASKIADIIYCNDRQLRSEVGGAATGTGLETVKHGMQEIKD